MKRVNFKKNVALTLVMTATVATLGANQTVYAEEMSSPKQILEAAAEDGSITYSDATQSFAVQSAFEEEISELSEEESPYFINETDFSLSKEPQLLAKASGQAKATYELAKKELSRVADKPSLVALKEVNEEYGYICVVYAKTVPSETRVLFTQYYQFVDESGVLKYQDVLYSCRYNNTEYLYVLGGDKIFYNSNKNEHSVKDVVVNENGTLTLSVKMFNNTKELKFAPYSGNVYAFSNYMQKTLVSKSDNALDKWAYSYYPTNSGETILYTENKEQYGIYQNNGESGKWRMYHAKLFVDTIPKKGQEYTSQYFWYTTGRATLCTMNKLGKN